MQRTNQYVAAHLESCATHAIDAATTKQAKPTQRPAPHRQLNMVIPGDSAARVWVEIKQ